MSLQLSLTDGTALTTTAGLPKNYRGAILQGATAYHTIASFGNIVVQEFRTPQLHIARMLVSWKKPERIRCEYKYPCPVFFSRAMGSNSMCEVIKGAGDMYLEKEQFALLTGTRWAGLMISEKPGEHHFTNFTWNADFVITLMSDDANFNKLSQRFVFDLPERLTITGRDLNDQMNSLIAEILHLDLGTSTDSTMLEQLMIKYIRLVFRELKEGESVKRKMKEADWHNINKAKKLIDYNLDTPFTIPDLSVKVGINEYKLKKLFPKVAGYTVEEYRKYKLLCLAARKIVQQPDASIKMFSEGAGYTTLSNFTRAFSKMGCTPGELRADTWDVSKFESYSIPQNERGND